MPDEWDSLGTVATAEPDEWDALATETPHETPAERLNVRTVNQPIPPGYRIEGNASAAELGAFPRLPVDRMGPVAAMLLDRRERAELAAAGARDSEPDVAVDAGPGPMAPFKQPWQEQLIRNVGTAFFDTPTVPFSKLNITPQQVSDALTPEERSQLPGGLAKVTAGAQQAVNQTLEGLTTPFAVATMGLGALQGPAARIISGLFAADMARHTPEQVKQFKLALDQGDAEAISRSATGLGLSATFIAGAVKHAATPESPAHDAGRMFLKELDNPRNNKRLQVAAEQFALKSSLPDQWQEVGRRVEPKPETPKEVMPRGEEAQRQEVLAEPAAAEPNAPAAAEFSREEIHQFHLARRDFGQIENVELELRRLASNGDRMAAIELDRRLKQHAVNMAGIPSETPLTPRPPERTLPKPPAAETITGRDEGVASEMPAEREKRPKPVATSSLTERPWDVLDEIESQIGGKIDPALIRKANPNWKPVGAAREIFRKGGHGADRALNAITYQTGGAVGGVRQDMGLQEFGEVINRAALARQRWIRENAKQDRHRLLHVEAKQVEQFERRVLAGERPKAEAANVERVPVEGLVEGDVFKVQDHEFEVRKLEFDENQNLVSIMVKDGPKFGVQSIEPGRSEFIHIDKGTMQPVPREAWMTPEPEPVAAPPPTLKGNQKQGDLLGSGDIDFNLYGEQAQSGERIAAERAAKEAAEQAAAEFAAKNQRQLPGTGGGFGDPIRAPIPPTTPPTTPATPPGGAPGEAALFDARLPVTLPRTGKGEVSIPQVMAALENVITAAGGQTPIRVGRFNKARARGIYKPHEEVTRINSADNIPTATHEIGHASQKLLYGSAYARALKGLPPAIKRELVALGKALYGKQKPAAGYSGEGWAEFIRHYITTDDAARLAPATEKFFREKVLVDHPELARAVKQARDLVDVYRAQGSVARAQQQLVKRPGRVASIVKTIRDFVSTRAQVEEFEPLWKISQGFEERSGNTLAPSADPFLLASWKRGTAGAVVETMVNDAMIDPWGNPLAGPGNVSLRQALAPIKGRGEDFALYLFGRRAVERHRQGKNPGITREDAQYLVQHFDSPEFQLAAQNYYQWNDGLLEYVATADPSMRGTVEAIRNASQDYAPLARVIDPAGATAAAAATRSNPLVRMHGSGRQVRDIFESTLENAARMVSHSHRKMVLESIVKLSKKEGMGFLVEEVPRSKVKTEVNFEKVREQLEEAGVDTSAIDEGTILSYFDLADKPKGADPIIVVKEADGLHWYHVSPEVYEILNGLEPTRLAPALDLLLGAPARAFRLGTTGLRASFSMFTNPVRDLRTLIMQTQSDANPARLAGAYFSAMGEVVRAGLGGHKSPHVEAFQRLGAQLGQPLGQDTLHTKRAAKGLFHGRMMRVVTNPIDHLRDLLQISESAPRVAELKMIAQDVGWKPGQTMTPEQAVQIALAAKRATVDFSAGGRISKVMNQAIPFYNATIQGTRSFARALRDKPARAVLYGLATFTVPALLNWWQNKDKEWYRQLPWRERYLYDNIDDGEGNVYQIPRPPEWGNFFSVLPEAMVDSWYRQDPRGAEEGLKHILATSNPLDFPVPLRIAREQWQNRIEFFDRPIVPRSQVDLPPGEQRGPYTTRLAQWIGDAFPNTASPRRIDAAVRGYFGGALPDLMDALGLGARKGTREDELSDLPVIGRMFRRGGEFSAQNLVMGDYYNELTRLSARIDAQDMAIREGRQPAAPLDAREYAYGKVLQEIRPYFHAASQVADRTASQSARQSLYRSMSREAERVLKLKPKLD